MKYNSGFERVNKNIERKFWLWFFCAAGMCGLPSPSDSSLIGSDGEPIAPARGRASGDLRRE
ncbi:hypothetical protein [Massilia horti]|uniref:Uncharacterized protein n=1 Tax=Massilia horti TaxID=2562153 RepID=A0A4Y9T304_9BURK|nr:hypothetical protein [Massilia horti]TFW32348.1 hypothetical protein E4O92_10300 [Massilia horti]